MLFDNLTYQMMITIKNIVLTLIDEKVLLNTVLVRLLSLVFLCYSCKIWANVGKAYGSGLTSARINDQV